MQVKIFSANTTDWLEGDMNLWLQENEDQIVVISIDPISVTSSASGVFYVCKINYQSINSVKFVDAK